MPEVKETERKSRGPAEASDAQMDGTGMDGGALCGASPWICGAWLRRLLHGWVGTVGVQAKLGRGGRRRLAYPRTHMQNCLFPDTWIHVDVDLHVSPGNTGTKTLPRFPSGATGSTLGNGDHRQLDAHGRGMRLFGKCVPWVGLIRK